jgi:hypothetical protein
MDYLSIDVLPSILKNKIHLEKPDFIAHFSIPVGRDHNLHQERNVIPDNTQ